jgi:hypothetical protein
VYFVLLARFSGSSSISSLSEESFLSLPLLVSASEMDTLLGSLTDSRDSTTICFFFFLERVPLSIAH